MPLRIGPTDINEPDTLRIPNVYMGIDPGAGGGIAVIWGKKVEVYKMPPTEKDLYDLITKLARLALFEGISDGDEDGECFTYLEQQIPRPTSIFDHKTKQFRATILKSTCLLYGNYKLLKGMLVAAQIPHEETPPKRWQTILKIPPREKGEAEGKWKNRLKAKAQSLFPSVKITLATADALLLAEACRRTRENFNVG